MALAKKPSSLWLVGPVVLAIIAVGFVAAPYSHPSYLHDFGALPLAKGATQTVTFQPGYTASYVVGATMDEKAARRLFPCNVEVGLTKAQGVDCSHNPAPTWPGNPNIVIASLGKSSQTPVFVEPGPPYGGQYSGGDYTWEMAYLSLKRGETYTLTFQQRADATSLAPARPRLTVDATAYVSESLMVEALFEFVAACASLFAAALWLLIGWLIARRRRLIGV